MDNTEKLIKDQFDSLPEDIKEALSRIPWKARIADIAKQEGLDADKSAALETETMLVLYGFMPIEGYPDNVRTETGLGDEAVDRIVKEVTDEIFADIEKQYEMIEAIEPKEALKQPLEKPAQPAPVATAPSMAPTPTVSVVGATTPTAAPASTNTLPEIMQNNFPAVEAGESAHETPRQSSEQATPAEKTFMNTPAPAIASAPTPAPAPASVERITPVESVKAPEPIPVPTVPTAPAEPATQAAPKSIVEEKLQNMTVATAPAAVAPAPEPAAPAAPVYEPGKDPYREPLE